jgi:SAM-dependent methyltransferase
MSGVSRPEFEIADCPLCGSQERVLWYTLAPYSVVRCVACGMGYLSPRLSETAMLAAYSSGGYFDGRAIGYDDYAVQEEALRSTFRRVSSGLVRAGYSGGDLLEIGAGYGFLLDALRPSFRSVMGTEFASEAATRAQQRGLDVRLGGLDELAGDLTFDCIVATHVIEHVYAPRAFIDAVRARLRPGGVVLLGTPDMGSVWRRVMGPRWPSFKVPEHVLYFDRAHLSQLLRDAGMEDVRSFPFLHSFPVSLILTKLGMASAGRRLGSVGRIPIPLPATTLALTARRPS